MSFWTSPTYRIVEAMKAAGNRPGVIARWRTMMEIWAAEPGNDDGRAAVRAWLPMWQPRSYYTAKELTPIFPALAVVLGFTRRMEAAKSPARLANELDLARLPKFDRDGATYYLVEHCHRIGEYRDADA